MVIASILSVLFSLIFSLIFTPLIRNFALKAHPSRIPHLGGLSVFFSFLMVVLFMSFRFGCFSPKFAGIIAGAIVIVILGLVDDFLELSPGVKFLGQTLAVIALLVFGVKTSIAAIGPVGNIVVTFFWMFAIINAFNLLDIMDGLCCGIAVIAVSAFLVISFLSQNILSAILCSSLIGAGLGFLRYNLPPAKIYLGDTGSMFFGFILAAIAIIIDYAPLKREIALLTPILVLGLPIFDTSFVVLMRLIHARPVTRRSKDHFALRLLSAGLSKPKALCFMYIFGLFFAGSSLIISRVTNQQGIAILIVIALICGIALKKIGAVKVDG